MGKELTDSEKLNYFYALALDQESDPAMVTAMMGAVSLGTVKLVYGLDGEPCLHTTEKGIKEAEQLAQTPAGREIVAKFKRLQIHKS